MVSSTNKYLCGIVALTALASGCGAAPSPFTLQFAATVNGVPVSCAAEFTGLGPSGQNTIGVSDLRFYVSNVQFWDRGGNPVALKLDDNEFQLNDPAGSVALIDLTGNTEGTCGRVPSPSPRGRSGPTASCAGPPLSKTSPPSRLRSACRRRS